MSNVVGLSAAAPMDVFTSLADRDVNPDAPICIGMDYNANINWICTLAAKSSHKRSFRASITPDLDDFRPENARFREKMKIFCIFSKTVQSNWTLVL